jgi:hypothetical protein
MLPVITLLLGRKRGLHVRQLQHIERGVDVKVVKPLGVNITEIDLR